MSDNLFMNGLSQIISLVGQAWTWFFQLLDGMGGAGTFITVFPVLVSIW